MNVPQQRQRAGIITDNGPNLALWYTNLIDDMKPGKYCKLDITILHWVNYSGRRRASSSVQSINGVYLPQKREN